MANVYVVALSGASGAVYGIELVKQLLLNQIQVHLILSDPARQVIAEERNQFLSQPPHTEELSKLFEGIPLDRLSIYAVQDLTAPIASGSFPVDGMVIMPCSMGTLGAIAGGLSQNLIQRAADCMLKENRPLVLVPRETPLNSIHLENMLKLSRLGVRIVPAMPAFYAGASDVEELVRFMVGKVLDQLGIRHFLYRRWTGPESKLSPEGRYV